MSTRIRIYSLSLVVFLLTAAAQGQTLILNPHLDYSSDSVDGPLITGDNSAAGVAPGKPNYIMIYGEGCYNSKRQARRTVELAAQYGDQVRFVLVDLDKPQSPAQMRLVKQYYQGSIPDLVLLDKVGKPIYNEAGEQTVEVLRKKLDAALAGAASAQQ